MFPFKNKLQTSVFQALETAKTLESFLMAMPGMAAQRHILLTMVGSNDEEKRH
jgi:hypothetical protein